MPTIFVLLVNSGLNYNQITLCMVKGYEILKVRYGIYVLLYVICASSKRECLTGFTHQNERQLTTLHKLANEIYLYIELSY